MIVLFRFIDYSDPDTATCSFCLRTYTTPGTWAQRFAIMKLWGTSKIGQPYEEVAVCSECEKKPEVIIEMAYYGLL